MARSSVGQSTRFLSGIAPVRIRAGQRGVSRLLSYRIQPEGASAAVEQISNRLMNWASILEPATREQAERTASMPFIYPHLALMLNVHLR
jgi:hypothetical protein